MYSVALMMAVTIGVDSPEFGRRGCCGCCGGCYGCYGGCYGCYGGCSGGYGGCYGGHGGCSGGYGGRYGYASVGYGGGYGWAYAPTTATPAVAAAPAPVRIVVTLPADARLTIDGAATTSTSDTRVFLSPELSPGRAYQYTLRAEVIRDGKPISLAQTVQVQAGKESRVTMTLPQRVALR